jgi:hypothetical protein
MNFYFEFIFETYRNQVAVLAILKFHGHIQNE